MLRIKLDGGLGDGPGRRRSECLEEVNDWAGDRQNGESEK